MRIILRHPRWRRLVPLTRKEQTRAAFVVCRAKAFIRYNNAADRLIASWSAFEKQGNGKKMCVIQKSAVVFHFAAVELWN